MVQAMDLVQELVTVNNLTTVCDSKLFNYGQMRDRLHDFTYTFRKGKVYGIIGECGAGGWALSSLLTGREKPLSGEIIIDNKVVDPSVFRDIGCYAGEGYKDKGLFGRKTVYKQLQDGAKRTKQSVQEIVEMFELSESRLHRTIDRVSNERWNASIAIGFANGKQIYCFPWLSTGWVANIKPRIELCINILKQHGAIVIFPTTKPENLYSIADEFVQVIDPDERLMEQRE